MLLLLFLAFLGGLGWAHAGHDFNGLWCWVVLLPLLLAWRRQGCAALLFVVLFGLSCGWWRGSLYMEKLAAYEPLYFQKISLTVRASEDGTYGKTKQLAFSAGSIVTEHGEQLTGHIQVTGFGINSVFQGDEIVVTGKLYPGYGAYQGRMSFSLLQLKAEHPSALAEVRRTFVAGAQTALPEPLASFVMGLLVGQRANLPESVKEDLRMVGLTHIIAVSGANLTIILQASQRLFGARSKRMSTLLSLGLLGVFLLLTGGSASIVRAAMVSMLSIMAGYYGRSFKPFNLIALAAVITAWANPVYLWSDLGWYLSFLAFFGVMILAPLVQARWQSRWHQTVLGGVALETICAEIMTLPFVLHIFGQMSRVGLLANVLVVTMIPLAMLLGLLSGLAGMLAGSVAGWFAWPAVLVLNYMLDVAHILAGLPHIFIEGIGLSLMQMLILYGCVGLLVTILWYKTDPKSVIITDMSKTKSKGLIA